MSYDPDAFNGTWGDHLEYKRSKRINEIYCPHCGELTRKYQSRCNHCHKSIGGT